ncbi:MAG: polyprenyl synthetase family protein [Clostridia bacterium]|nr:polyprenyl synthetase family protein [Clostridia bacterium]
MTAKQILESGKALTEQKISDVLNIPACKYDSVIDAMKYSALAGGKRLRPSLLLEFYRLCGGEYIDDALCFAAALEFIHTYSLIHDDLPCMDDDDMRRGRPSCHIKFGEDTALLAGDALLTLAFRVASSTQNTKPEPTLKAINLLAERSGVHGMIGGQVIDLAIENSGADLDTVFDMYSKKTGALIRVAAEIGCILADADDKKIAAAIDYANNIGLAFQITDDILDLTSTAEELGKPIGSDQKNNKSTAVSILGIEGAAEYVEKLSSNAAESLSVFGPQADGLLELSEILINRKN